MLSAPAPFSRRRIPSSHHREEGWPSDQENIAQHPLSRGRGGVPIDETRNTPRPPSLRKLRTMLLVTPPPLIVPKMKVCSMLINSSRACGKCGKAERLSEAFPSSCGNPHQGEAAEGNRFFRGFP